MGFLPKNTDELNSMQELQNNYNSLKESYDKCLADKNLQEIAISKLNKFSIELLNLSPLVNLEVVIARMIKEITNARAAVFSNYDPVSRNLNVQHIEVEPGLVEKIVNLIGKQVKKIQAYVDEETYNLITTEVIGYRDTLHEVSFGSIPRPVSAAIQKLLKVNRFIAIVYVIDKKLYGTTVLGMGKDQPDPPKQVLENIIFLAAVTLKRKKAEEDILDSEERFRLLFEAAHDAIFLTDPVTRKILNANKAASALLLKKHEEILEMYQHDLHPPHISDYTKITFDRQLNEAQYLGFIRPVETSVLRSDGNWVPVEVSYQMIMFQGQKVLMGNFRNITERKQTEVLMHQILTELQTLIENIQQGVLLENEDRNIQFSNKKFCELFGLNSPKEIFGTSGVDLSRKLQYHFADPVDFIKSVEKRLTEQKIMLSEELKLEDGRIFERDYIPVSIDGRKNRNYWIYRDITERKHAEKALVDSQSQIAALLRAIPDLLFIQNKEGVYMDYHAPEGTRLLTMPESFIGKTMHEILPVEIANSFQKVFENAILTKHVQNFEYSLCLQNKIAYFESRSVAYEEDKILSLVRDITRRKQSELQVQHQNQELKKLNEDKDRFMSILAHDLKSPFNSILGLLDLISLNIYKYDLQKIEQFIDLVKKSSLQYYHLLEDLLLWARAQSGKMTFEPQHLNFFDICKQIVEEQKLNAEAKHIDIKLLEVETFILADPEMLKTILRNLISNAIKFTMQGGKIEISTEDGYDHLTITVADNGIGIAEDKLNNLFDIAVSNSFIGTAGEKGTGLGLFLCKELIEKHNGKIWVESNLNSGSKFKFTLPK